PFVRQGHCNLVRVPPAHRRHRGGGDGAVPARPAATAPGRVRAAALLMAARDARLPLLLAFAGSLMLAVSHELARSVLAAVLLLPLALWRWRGQQRALLRRLIPANILLLFMLLLLAVDISAWSLSPAGLDLGLLALARANGAMLLCAIALRRQNADSLAA